MIYACEKVESYKTIPHCKNIRTVDFNPQKLNFSDDTLIKDIKYIKLESSTDCIIGDIDRIIYKDSKFYIFDRMITKSIFVFRYDGKYLFKISKYGRGPSEYNMPLNFDIDKNGNIYIGDIQKQIFKYDSLGNYKTKYRTNYYFEEFCLINKEKLLVRNPYKSKIIANSAILRLKDRLLTKIIEERPIIDNFDLPRYSNFYFYRSDSIIYYSPDFSNKVYRISEGNIGIMLAFDKSLCPPIDFIEKAGKMKEPLITSSRYIVNIRDIYETEKFISLVFQKQVPAFMLISKNTNDIKNFYTFKDNRFLADNRIYGVAKNKFITILPTSKINSKWKSKVLNSDLSKNEKEELLQLNYSSNPTICLIEMKDF